MLAETYKCNTNFQIKVSGLYAKASPLTFAKHCERNKLAREQLIKNTKAFAGNLIKTIEASWKKLNILLILLGFTLKIKIISRASIMTRKK